MAVLALQLDLTAFKVFPNLNSTFSTNWSSRFVKHHVGKGNAQLQRSSLTLQRSQPDRDKF